MKSVSELIKQVARGKNGSENLSQIEAREVFSKLLKADADPLQLGAFLIAQRMKGETAAEIAGFVDACRASIAGFGEVAAPAHAVDLPCYAGKRRGTHAHIAAALQVRDRGIPVFVHGVASIEGRITAWQVLERCGIQRAKSLKEVADIIDSDNMVYIDLAEISPALHRIYQLRPRLGVRSFANTVARLLNPMQCEGQLNGVFHPPYVDLMSRANVLLGQARSSIFMGAEGEPELYADRQKLAKIQIGKSISELHFPDSGDNPYPKEVLINSMNGTHESSIADPGVDNLINSNAIAGDSRLGLGDAESHELPSRTDQHLLKSAAGDLSQLFHIFDAIRQQDGNSREHSTMRRMQEAFLQVSGRKALNNHE